jgi:AmpE protein
MVLCVERLLAPWRDSIALSGLTLRNRLGGAAQWWRTRFGVLLLVLVPTLLTVLAQLAAELNPLTATLFGAAVLFLCLGPRDLAEDLRRLSRAWSGHDEAEQQRLWRILRAGPQPDAAHQPLLGTLFIQSHETLFGVLIWFAVAGPAGAVFYRCVSRLQRILVPADERGFRTGVWMHELAAFVPTRLTAALFALAGSTNAGISAWRRVEQDASEPSLRRGWALLAETASAASVMEPEDHLLEHARMDVALREVLRMQRRALLIGLAIYAVLVAGLWIG